MLEALHSDGKLIKVGTSDVLMTPDTSNIVQLSELNALIAEQKGLAIDELAGFIGVKPGAEVKEIARVNEVPVQETEKAPDVLDDSALAKQFRSQADAMYKEAAKLRKQADELDPPVKKATKAKETADIKFEDGRVWEINVAELVEEIGSDALSTKLLDTFKEYHEEIKGVDFDIDISKLKTDIKKSTKTIL